MQFERTYAKKCYAVHPEPLDTVKFTVSGSSRRVIYNRQGMPLLVDPGSSGSAYLFTVRKKYAQLYVDTYYNTNRLLMENDGTFVITKVFNYLSELFDRVGCDDKRVKLLEDQLYSTIITFDDENRGKYMREYKKYTQTGSPDQEVAVRNHRRSYGPPASYNWDSWPAIVSY
jgi:hypothetical protein